MSNIETILIDPTIEWEMKEVSWYGGKRKTVQYYTGICLWHVMTYSSTPISIRYVLIKDLENILSPILLMSTNLELASGEIIENYVARWNIEVSFHESREHLGIETQRQWSDKAIARTTPILFALYSLVILVGNTLFKTGKVEIEQTAWYTKDDFKFSDITTLWHPIGTCSMGNNPKKNVVDSQLNVHGLCGIRVIDASIMPLLPSGNTQAPCYLIGEKGADFIIQKELGDRKS